MNVMLLLPFALVVLPGLLEEVFGCSSISAARSSRSGRILASDTNATLIRLKRSLEGLIRYHGWAGPDESE